MLDNNLNALEKEIKNIDYQDDYLIITMMDDSQKVITYSEERLHELRTKMIDNYGQNKQKYLRSLDMALEFTKNAKLISLVFMLGSFALLYNIDGEIESKIIAGLCFASATVLYNVYKDNLKEKYEDLKNRIKMLSYYIDNIEQFKTTNDDGSENYSINIEEVNHKGMTLKKLKGYANNNDMI